LHQDGKTQECGGGPQLAEPRSPGHHDGGSALRQLGHRPAQTDQEQGRALFIDALIHQAVLGTPLGRPWQLSGLLCSPFSWTDRMDLAQHVRIQARGQPAGLLP
jgi:hypothetical protein